jgi:hypothetical protein
VIDILVPRQKGGVHAFGSVLCEALGRSTARLVPLNRESLSAWRPGPSDVVYLQYSGYGYAKRGAPLWLVTALKSRRGKVRKIGVYFHELFATGQPWRSSFWLSPLQRHICRTLANLSDFWITNRQASALWLKERTAQRPHAVLPVFSCVGEAGGSSEPRKPRIAIFGGPGLRQATYRAVGERLFTWAERTSVEVHDIGPLLQDSYVRASLRLHGVIEHGYLGELAVRDLLRTAMFGLLAYPVGYAAKSSVLAAYCAHGMCPVIVSGSQEQADGLVAHANYLPELPAAISAVQVARIGEAAEEWYAGHRLDVHVRTLSTLSSHAATVDEC